MKRRFAVDNKNQLMVKSPKTKAPLAARGNFLIGKNNQLVYRLNEPAAWKMTHELPNKIFFRGNWRINANYDLELGLDEIKEQYASYTRTASLRNKGGRLVLKGKIISTDRDTLAFEIKSSDRHGLAQVYLLRLNGSWQADEHNQIRFVINKKAAPDIITLEGAWQVNQNQQIVYNYEKIDLKTKTRTFHSLEFDGFWQINSANKLAYIFLHSLKSGFEFRAQIESPNVYPQEGLIKYRLGAGVKKSRAYQGKVIPFYGAWKFSRRLGLRFQMDYGRDRLKLLEFGADVHLTRRNRIEFSLTGRRKEPLGINVIFTHRFLNKLDAEAFVRLKGSFKKGTAAETGMRIPF